VPPSHPWVIRGISKWKNWQYLKRTFCMRNTLPTLFRSGQEAFMTSVLRQLLNWGLPRQFHDANRALLSAWGQWMLDQEGCKKQFMTDSNKFSYLSYLDRFLPLYQSGALSGLLLGEGDRRCTVLFVLCFDTTRPAWVSEITKGYAVKENYNPKKDKTFMPGWAYFLDMRLPDPASCRCPYFTVIIPPSDTCTDKKAINMYPRFRPVAPSFVISSEQQLPELASEMELFESAHVPKRVHLVAMVGLPPGSGKSTVSEALLAALGHTALKGTVVSSDYYGMIHGAGTGLAKNAFECAVITALSSGVFDVVIFDKNIPGMQGYESMCNIASRAALPKLTIVPVVPRSLSLSDCDLFLQRVLSRAPGSHTLTGDSEIPGFESVEDFVMNIFAKPCIDFVPVAQLLPGAVVLDDMFQPDTEAINATFLADQLVHWEQRSGNVAGINLSSGDYLGLCFELDAATKLLFEELLDSPVRELVHATIVYYRRDTARMAEAARLLQTVDAAVPVCVSVTALKVARGALGMLAWGSLTIPGFEGEPMHATLVADGYPAMLAREGEIAFRSDSTSTSDTKKIVIGDEELPIQNIELEPMPFEAYWSVC
jgi:hypothetical protein